MKYYILLILISLKLTSNAQGPILTEEVAFNSAEPLKIPFKKYLYPNGLILIVHEDHSSPLVYVDITYKVGSSRELPGQSGFAHFFEHLMFEGTKNLSKTEFYKLFPEAYSNFNGHTTADQTKYEELIPMNYLETALWMEADRMINIGNSITQQKLDLQRKIIINEKYERDINTQYGIADEKINETVFPVEHPYAWPVIGYISDLNSATVDDMKGFFYKWYCPSNAILTVSGNVNTDEVVAMTTKYFSVIPKGEKAHELPLLNQKLLSENKNITYRDDVSFGLVKTAFPTVESWNKDEPALDALAYILNQQDNKKRSGDDRSIGMYNVGGGLHIYHPCKSLSGLFYIDIYIDKDQTADEVSEAIRNTFKSYSKKGAAEENLMEFKAYKKKSFYSSLESIVEKGKLLSYYESSKGTPDMIKKDWDRYSSISLEDINSVFKNYLYEKPNITLFVKPGFMKDDYIDKSTKKIGLQTTDIKFTDLQVKTLSAIVSPPKPQLKYEFNGTPTKYWISKLQNNLTVAGVKNEKSPITYLRIKFIGGAAQSYAKKAGIAGFLATALNMGKTSTTKADINNNNLRLLGSDVNFSVTDEDINLDIETLNEHFGQTMDIVQDILENFILDMNSLSIYSYAYGMYKQDMKKPRIAARNIFYNKLYPFLHVMHYPYMGDPTTIKNIMDNDIYDFYNNVMSTVNSTITVESNLDSSVIVKRLKFLEKFDRKPVYKKYIASEIPKKSEIFLMNNQNETQSEILVGTHGLPKDDTGDYFKIQLLNYIIGGSINGRMNNNLREKYGSTYNITSQFLGTKYLDVFKCRTSVATNQTDTALTNILQTIRDLHDNGITDEEFKMIKQQFNESSYLENYGSEDKFSYLQDLIDLGFNTDLLKVQKAIIASITKEELNALAKKYLYPDNLIIVIVGDHYSFIDKLKKLNIPITPVETED